MRREQELEHGRDPGRADPPRLSRSAVRLAAVGRLLIGPI